MDYNHNLHTQWPLNASVDRLLPFMAMAQDLAQLSRADRLKVGALLLVNGRILSTGYNGNPPGGSNKAEQPDGQTKPEVVHAEANAICFAARHGVAVNGATLVCTHSPCIECAKLLLQAGITVVIYGEQYRDDAGIVLLREHGVYVLAIGEFQSFNQLLEP